MGVFFRSTTTAVFIAVAVQLFSVGLLAPNMSLKVCRPDVHRTYTRTLPAARMIRITNQDGDIRFETYSGKELHVTAHVRAYAPKRERRDAAEAYVDSLIQENSFLGYVYLVTEPKERPEDLELRVDYEVKVPAGTDVMVTATNGNVRVGAGCGMVSIEGNNSDIEVVNAQGVVRAKSTNGRIRVQGAPKGATIETVNGNIACVADGGALTASTANGHIDATLRGRDLRSADLTSTNGHITLAVSAGCSAEVSAKTDRGYVTTNLSGAGAESGAPRRVWKGLVGDGRTRLTATSLNGNISITRSDT